MGIQTMGIYGSDQGFHSQQPLVKQSSWYSLKLREIEEKLGKPLGSMNLDELLNSVTTVEANERFGVSTASANSLQLQASLTLVRGLSGKTVDEVWRDINHGMESKFDHEGGHGHERVSSLGHITLENFIVKVGIFVAESSLAPTMGLDHMLSVPQAYAPNMSLPSSPSVETLSDVPDNHKGYIEGDVTESSLAPTMRLDPMLSAAQAYKPHMGLPSPLSVETLSDAPDNKRYIEGDVFQSSTAPTMRLDPMLSAPQTYKPHVGLPPSPSIETLSDAPENHKKYIEGDVVENTLDKRLKRKMKNRESAARSRARKQAYQDELVSKVSHLEVVNMKLKKEKEFDNMLTYNSSSQARYQLRRTSSF